MLNMLVAHEVGLEVVRLIRPVVERLRKFDNEQAKQIRNAASSAMRNLAEGAYHKGGNKRLKYEIAVGEAAEVKAALETAVAWGYLDDYDSVRPTLGRWLALCYGLANPKPDPKDQSARPCTSSPPCPSSDATAVRADDR